METVEVEKRGSVSWVWLNRPSKLNTFDATLIGELPEAFSAVDDDPETRAIVLAGRGRAFSAGFDVGFLLSQGTESLRDGLPNVTGIFDLIETSQKPVIGAVHGPAAGLGLILAMVCDLRLCSEQAAFIAPEVKLGLFTPAYLTHRLERLVGVGNAKQICLTGEPVGAQEAYRIGLVNGVAKGDSLNDQAQALAEQIAALPSIAVQTTKAIYALEDRGDYAAWEQQQMAACWDSPEREAAMIAFMTRKR